MVMRMIVTSARTFAVCVRFVAMRLARDV